MDSVRLMLLSLMIGATASTGVGTATTVAAPQAIVAQQETAQQTIYATPIPTVAPTPAQTASANVQKASAPKAASTELSRGSKGDGVRAVQKLLLDLKYSVTVDGTFGTQTYNAVVSFQKNNGLKADGIVGSRTYRVLTSGSAKGPATVSTNRTTLSYGMRGADVRKLQSSLLSLGYYYEIVTGNYLNKTRDAVCWFQQVNGLAVDGMAGPTTLTRLYSGRAIPASGSSPAVPPIAPAPGGSAPVLGRPLGFGMSGNDVTRLQQKLSDLLYFSGTATGYYGEATAAAVRLFQSVNGLTADGIAGAATQSRMFGGNAIPYSGGFAPQPPSSSICGHCGAGIVPGDMSHVTQLVSGCGHYQCQSAMSANHTMLMCGHYACRTTPGMGGILCSMCGR